MTRAELWTKFADCGARSLPAAQLPPLFETLAAIETGDGHPLDASAIGAA